MPPEIEIYSSNWCPWCARAKALLRRKGVGYREIAAERGSEARQESQRRSGRSSVPQIFIGGRHIGGSDELAALDRSGELDALLAGD